MGHIRVHIKFFYFNCHLVVETQPSLFEDMPVILGHPFVIMTCFFSVKITGTWYYRTIFTCFSILL